MSRAYFKNDLYHFTAQSTPNPSAQPSNRKDKEKEKPTPQKDIPVDDNLNIRWNSQPLVREEANHQQIDEMMKELGKKGDENKKKDHNSNNKGKRLSIFQKPRNSLVVREPEVEVEKTEQQERKEKIKESKMYKQLQAELKKQADKQDAWNNGKHSKKIEAQQQEAKDGSEDSSDSEKPQQPQNSAPKKAGKNKRIKKYANYQRLDLKRKYQDRFRGALAKNLQRYNRNGTLKFKYRTAASQLDLEEGALFNTYISSLSSALCTTISLDDDDNEEVEAVNIKDVPLPVQYTKEALTDYLRAAFGFEDFREGQAETIINILKGESTLFVSETASGKSLAYILTSMVLGSGLSLVISPLVSLMLDQLAHMPENLPAACISSLLNREQRDRIINLVKSGQVRLLFVTPESLQTDFAYHLQDFPPVHFTCIDEAHSLSELSHNFRTSFLALGDIVKGIVRYQTGRPVILALTATANVETIASIQDKLSIPNLVRSHSVMNKNLFITVTRQGGPVKYDSLIKYLRHPHINACQGILVYTRTKKIMFEVFNYISNSTDLNVAIYHGQLSNKEKTETLNQFREGIKKVVVATIALGMGLDFSHLECVVHMNIPKSIENYVQQIGRAGRRQRRAYCHLFLDNNDYFTERNYIVADELEEESLKAIYHHLKMRSTMRVQDDKIDENQQAEKAIKQATLMISGGEERIKEIIYEEEEEDNQSEEEHKNIMVEDVDRLKSKLFSMPVQELVSLSKLREEALLTLLLKIQAVMSDSQMHFRVLPLSNQTLKIGFAKKDNEKQLCESEPFFKELISGCRRANGFILINLIAKCNQMATKPIELMTKLYRIAHEYWLRLEPGKPVFVWRFEGKRTMNGTLDHQRVRLISEAFQRLESQEGMEKVIKTMNEVQGTALRKLNALYSLSYLHSNNSMDNIISKNILLNPEAPLPRDTVAAQFDKYFAQTLSSFESSNQILGQNSCIPTRPVEEGDIKQIQGNTRLFIRHQTANLGELKDSEVQYGKLELLKRYADGKNLTKIFMGITSGEVKWQIYSDRPYWNEFRNRNYHELLEHVQIAMKMLRHETEQIIAAQEDQRMM